MAINEWWTTDPTQRFWMEITDRPDLGADLNAPAANRGGKSYWGYELITHVPPGDVVLHWHKDLLGEPAIVGWSQASGVYENTKMSWQTHAKVKGSAKPRAAWRMPLENYTPLVNPVFLSAVRKRETKLRKAQADLEAKFKGTLYFPFAFSDKQPLRVQQTYFVKLPREVLHVLGLADLSAATSSPWTHDASAHKKSKGPAAKPKQKKSADAGHGYMSDSAVRSAIERRAVELATDHYEAMKYKVKDTGTRRSYDLKVTRKGEVRRVEVKGSSRKVNAVELTIKEVENSHKKTPTDLYVVDEIEWIRLPNGAVEADGGTTRWWQDWSAADERLTVTRYRYQLPDAPESPPA